MATTIKSKANKPRHEAITSRSVSMIFRRYNLNPVIDVRPRWWRCALFNAAKEMSKSQTICVAAVLLGFVAPAVAEEAKAFEPPIAFRSIDSVEYGGGPIRRYIAPKFETMDILVDRPDLRIIFTTALPPTTATRTVVAGLFVVRHSPEGWITEDGKRFEAIGLSAGASAGATHGEKGVPHITVSLVQGGKSQFYTQSVSYVMKGTLLISDPPKERALASKQPAAGHPAPRPEEKPEGGEKPQPDAAGRSR